MIARLQANTPTGSKDLTMRWLEVRRHSATKRSREPGSHLSPEGVDLARRVGRSLGSFASVVTSASPRAIETALAMGYAVDDTADLPSGYLPGQVEHHEQWHCLSPTADAELLAQSPGLAASPTPTVNYGPSSWPPHPMALPCWLSATAAVSNRHW
jgi:hypothetical protein